MRLWVCLLGAVCCWWRKRRPCDVFCLLGGERRTSGGAVSSVVEVAVEFAVEVAVEFAAEVEADLDVPLFGGRQDT